MGPWAMSLLLLLSLAGFLALAWRKLRILRVLAPEPRLDQPLARLRTVLWNGLLQQRLLRGDWRAGAMHAVIFVGFLSLLLRKLQLVAIAYVETASWPGLFGGAFAAFKDFVELAVLMAVLYALWRRLVRRPARLEPNREAVLVLGLILAIMLTDLGFDAFRFARLAATSPQVAHERDWAWLGGALGQWAAQAPPGWQELAYRGFFWLQMLVVLSFLVLLPWGEHFHIVTALPTLFFRRGRPANQVPAVDLDKLMEATDEADMKAGVQTARDLNWKQGLDVFTCTECGRCKQACPTHLTSKPLSMKAVNDSLKHHLLAQGPALAQPGAELPPLLGPVISEDTLWACTTCGACEAACPIELEHLERFYGMRQHQVLIAGEFPHALKKVFEAWESQGNPWGLPVEQRGDWATGLGVTVVHTAEDLQALDALFYVGSALSYDPRGQKIARAFVRVAQRAGVRLGILGAAEGSTGECARRLGNEMLFQQLGSTLVERLNEVGARRIVTCDPHALNALRQELPALGGHYQVIHHSTLLAQWLREGRIRVRPQPQRLMFHDPCYLGRHNGEFEAPREVLARLGGGPPLEFELHGMQSMCCGAGGGRMWLEETLGTRINVLRVQQALPQQPDVLATACPYCAVMLGDGLATVAAAQGPAQLDLAELVLQALEPTA